MRYYLQLTAVAVVFAVLGFSGMYFVPTAEAQSAPGFHRFPADVGIISSTADQDILAAPGSTQRWVITSLQYNVLVEESDATVTVEDKAGTPIDICEFAPETQGFGVLYDFGEGIECSQNSGVTVDFSGSTADCWIAVTAYKERVE